MSKYRNEQGIALVLTMFIITILMLFISAQFYQVTNTRKQVSTMEKNLMAKHMAEMGVDHYRAAIEQIGDQASISEYEQKIPKEISRVDITTQGDRSYAIAEKDVKIATLKDSDLKVDNITIEFTSTGQAFGAIKKIKSTITITITGLTDEVGAE